MTHVRMVLAAALGFAAFLLGWHLATLGHGRSDVPGPWLTLLGLRDLVARGVLWSYIVASVFRVGWGFCLAALIGVPLGLGFGWYPRFRKVFNPVTQALRPISPIAWLPIAVLLFGGTKWWDASDLAAIFLIFLASFFPIVTASMSAVGSIDRKYFLAARNFGMWGPRFHLQVVLPAALPQILSGLRLALGIAWVVVVAAEMLGVQSGLGFLINDARNNLRYDYVAAAMVVISIIGLMLDAGMATIERGALRRRGLAK